MATDELAPSPYDNYIKRFEGDISYLTENELWWPDHQPWLQERDGLKIVRGYVLDAIWISDNTVVTMKKINLSKHSLEVDICRYFLSEPRANDPANHCVPVYEVLDVPDNSDRKILFMPLLRKFTSPRFFTSGEAVELVRQVLDGLRFIHSHWHVARRDCGRGNITTDPILSSRTLPFHSHGG